MVANRPNRKASDEDILRLNSCGLSLQTIGNLTGVHPTSVTARLKSRGVAPADTRRSFMEMIFRELNPSQQDWLCDELNKNVPVREYITNLIKEKYEQSQKNGDVVQESTPES